ncbi:MAG: tetratricopeptide repeat protein [Hyphomicrobiaceae bacterium]
MTKDAQGHELTNATSEAAGHLDQAARAFTLAYGDVMADLDNAAKAAPQAPMVALIKAWVQALSNDPAMVEAARAALPAIQQLTMNEREQAHASALAEAVASRWASAVAILDRHLMHYPHDLMAHQCAMRLDGFQGRFHLAAGRSARALPLWSKDQPGYGILLSFLGFGLEEAGDYAKAEDISRQAALLEPHGYWPHHAVSHVLEMTGRPSEGLQWMNERQALWAGKANSNRVHIWWHKSLFHVELGQYDQALKLYDDEILPTLRPVGTSLCNPTALLWRLEALGCPAGDRWRHVADLWQERANGRTSMFNDIHAAITAVRAGEDARFETLLHAMRATAAANGPFAANYRDVGIPIAEAMASFHRRDYTDAVERLMPVRFELWRMGGSKAQRDLIEWTLTEAAVRAGNRDAALALAHERLAARPQSTVNRHFLAEAEAIAA